MCSGPSSSMIAVPDAALLPSTPRPVCRENSARISFENPFGNVGNARSSTMPIISQWPVTESLPAEASAMRPHATVRIADCGLRIALPIAPTRSSPSARSVGTSSGTCLWMLPSVLLPWSPYAPASGSSPTPTLSITITMTRLKNATLLVREVVGHRLRCANRGDGVLEDHVVRARVFEHEREPLEVLDAPFELAPVHHADGHGELLTADVIEKYVLDVGLAGFGIRCGRHRRQSGVERPRSSPATPPGHRARQD